MSRHTVASITLPSGAAMVSAGIHPLPGVAPSAACPGQGGERTLRLSPSQHRLWAFLAARRGVVVPHADIERAVYGRVKSGRRRASGASNTIAVFVSQLRRQLGQQAIVTIHGVGYSMPGAMRDGAHGAC